MTTRFLSFRTATRMVVLSATLLMATPRVMAQEVPAPPANGTPTTTEDLERIKKILGREPELNLDEERLRFYTSVSMKAPLTFSEYVKGYDMWNGPTKGGNPMTHQEFINMVTPRELYGSGGITANEILQFALTNWLGQALIRRGLEELKEARTEREAREIRDRIDRELAALRASGGN